MLAIEVGHIFPRHLRNDVPSTQELLVVEPVSERDITSEDTFRHLRHALHPANNLHEVGYDGKAAILEYLGPCGVLSGLATDVQGGAGKIRDIGWFMVYSLGAPHLQEVSHVV